MQEWLDKATEEIGYATGMMAMSLPDSHSRRLKSPHKDTSGFQRITNVLEEFV